VSSSNKFRPGFTRKDGVWSNDSNFTKRWVSGNKATPYIRNSHGHLLWDLGFSGRGPTQNEISQVEGTVLVDADRWIEYRHPELRLGWYAHNAHGRTQVTIIVDSIIWLACEPAKDAGCVCLMVHVSPASAAQSPGAVRANSDVVSISISFGQQYYKALWDLCAFIEHRCGRVLAPPFDVAAHEIHDGQYVGGHNSGHSVDGGRPASSGQSTAGLDQSPDAADQQGGTVEPSRTPAHSDSDQGVVRSGTEASDRQATGAVDLAFAVVVERVPDTPRWISFAAPTTEDLLGESTVGISDSPGLDPAAPVLPDSADETAAKP
jgi:hypothetical protein